MTDFPNLLTLRDVAGLLRCSKAQVCRVVLGRVVGCTPLPAIALGRRKLIRKEVLLAWIEANEQASSGNATIPSSPRRDAGKRA